MARQTEFIQLSAEERRELAQQVASLVKEREKLKVKIEWQFSISQAQEKLNRHYENVIQKTYITKH